MSHPEPWAISGLHAAVFVAANWVNISLLLHARRAEDEDTRRSPIVLIGGLGGAMSFALSPNETLRAYYWAPLIVDLGTGPYLALILWVLAQRVWKSRDWMKSVPFVHYLFEREPPAQGPYPKEKAIVGCILGTAVGDALGLACEGLSRRRQSRMFPEIAG
jgi:hypothetical protein